MKGVVSCPQCGRSLVVAMNGGTECACGWRIHVDSVLGPVERPPVEEAKKP